MHEEQAAVVGAAEVSHRGQHLACSRWGHRDTLMKSREEESVQAADTEEAPRRRLEGLVRIAWSIPSVPGRTVMVRFCIRPKFRW